MFADALLQIHEYNTRLSIMCMLQTDNASIMKRLCENDGVSRAKINTT